jgi:hypothetical protein
MRLQEEERDEKRRREGGRRRRGEGAQLHRERENTKHLSN